jgi:hypothetical protein
LENLKNIYVVAQEGEVKEVLCEIDYLAPSNQKEINIVSVDIEERFTNHFSSTFNKQHECILSNTLSYKYFYEASSALVKAGLSVAYANTLELYSISKNVPYFVSNNKLDNFMGRRFDIVNSFVFSKKNFKDYLKANNIIKANVSRNLFPISPEEIKKQFQIQDGGVEYLFFTTAINGAKLVLHCRKNKSD